ncbi:MAG: ribonucleotide reductase subunit alpha [Rubellimicrobium sp.]|nr:ribonucleotide reductase subunit alpha [Rubellimicrobium sp.]
MAETIDSFDDLLRVARAQAERQRFLFVFLRAELPEDAGPEQEARFAAGQGGALAPVMYADKALHELRDFATLRAESQRTADHLGQGQEVEPDWDILLVGILAGGTMREPDEDQVNSALQTMLRTVREGRSLAHLAAFDRDGHPVSFG